jgi:hypothetical protein
MYHLPALSLIPLIESFWHSSAESMAVLALFPLWDICVGLFLCKCIDTFIEQNPDGFRNFDWTGFSVRAVSGAVLGIFFGWRLWISYGKGATSLILTMLVLGSTIGLAFGLFYRDNYWTRPL